MHMFHHGSQKPGRCTSPWFLVSSYEKWKGLLTGGLCDRCPHASQEPYQLPLLTETASPLHPMATPPGERGLLEHCSCSTWNDHPFPLAATETQRRVCFLRLRRGNNIQFCLKGILLSEIKVPIFYMFTLLNSDEGATSSLLRWVGYDNSGSWSFCAMT